MIASRKGIEGHVIVVLVVAFLMSILLFVIIEFAYESDDPICQNLIFDYDISCKTSTGYRVYVENFGMYPITFQIDGVVDDSYYVASEEGKQIIPNSEGRSTRVVPIAFDEDGDGHLCRSQQVRANLEVLATC